MDSDTNNCSQTSKITAYKRPRPYDAVIDKEYDENNGKRIEKKRKAIKSKRSVSNKGTDEDVTTTPRFRSQIAYYRNPVVDPAMWKILELSVEDISLIIEQMNILELLRMSIEHAEVPGDVIIPLYKGVCTEIDYTGKPGVLRKLLHMYKKTFLSATFPRNETKNKIKKDEDNGRIPNIPEYTLSDAEGKTLQICFGKILDQTKMTYPNVFEMERASMVTGFFSNKDQSFECGSCYTKTTMDRYVWNTTEFSSRTIRI